MIADSYAAHRIVLLRRLCLEWGAMSSLSSDFNATSCHGLKVWQLVENEALYLSRSGNEH